MAIHTTHRQSKALCSKKSQMPQTPPLPGEKTSCAYPCIFLYLIETLHRTRIPDIYIPIPKHLELLDMSLAPYHFLTPFNGELVSPHCCQISGRYLNPKEVGLPRKGDYITHTQALTSSPLTLTSLSIHRSLLTTCALLRVYQRATPPKSAQHLLSVHFFTPPTICPTTDSWTSPSLHLLRWLRLSIAP